MNGVCGFGVRTLAHLFICSGPKPAEQGWRSGPRWVLLSHQGQLSRETGGGRGAEGGMEWREGDRSPGWETRSRSIFPSSLSVMSSHFVRFCWWHTFSAHRPISRPGGEKKRRRRRWRCVHWPQSCMFERACREGERTLPRVVRAGFCQAVLSPRTVSEQTRGPSGELHSSSSPPSMPAEVAASKALSVHNALEASSSWQPPLPPSTPACPSANQKRHIRMSRRTHTRAQTHTRRNLLIKKCISWRPTPKRNPAGRNWNNLLAYKFSLTVSPRLFISVIGNVSNVAKLTKSNSFDQKMNLARLSVCRCPAGRGGGTNKTKRRRLRERQKERLFSKWPGEWRMP